MNPYPAQLQPCPLEKRQRLFAGMQAIKRSIGEPQHDTLYIMHELQQLISSRPGRVVSGNLPSTDGKYGLYCAVIVKRVDAQTRAKMTIDELLRTDD
ncbi:MAG: hypothetical protein WC073_15540 [Sterolibacterium sp.]